MLSFMFSATLNPTRNTFTNLLTHFQRLFIQIEYRQTGVTSAVPCNACQSSFLTEYEKIASSNKVLIGYILSEKQYLISHFMKKRK